jgi:putative hydrolase of the HAD superfamily
MIRYLLFDAANTLMHKPSLWGSISSVLTSHGYIVEQDKLMYNHKLLSESIIFPDRTNSDFYSSFNAELLMSLGILPTPQLLKDLFEKCSYLPWEIFEDVQALHSIDLPMAILSNFHTSLDDIIGKATDVKFKEIISSEREGVRKPDIEFYKIAIQKLGVNAGEILYIGDSLKLDYEPATKTGMQALIIDRINFYPDLPYIIKSFGSIQSHINLI